VQLQKKINSVADKLKTLFPDDKSQCVFPSKEKCQAAAKERWDKTKLAIWDLIRDAYSHRDPSDRPSGPDQHPREGKDESLLKDFEVSKWGGEVPPARRGELEAKEGDSEWICPLEVKLLGGKVKT
jgi:hypothetical protein